VLPYDIRTQIIQCIGTCFHYKDNVESFFISCGIDKKLASKHRGLAKFVWTRNLLNDLDELENGYELQRRILTELCKFRNIPDRDAPNPNAGLNNLRKLKQLAKENKLVVEEENRNIKQRKNMAAYKAKIIAERAEKLKELKEDYFRGFSEGDRQKADYILENILERLFPLFELEYKKPYKTATQQIDGHFGFEGFNYLVEAKWQKELPSESEIGGFKRKVDTKLESTRGVFISINGFREEVVKSFEGNKSNILFFDGEDLMHIIEGRVDLQDAIYTKIQKASQEGIAYFPVSRMLL